MTLVVAANASGAVTSRLKNIRSQWWANLMQAQILIYVSTFLFYASALMIHNGLYAEAVNDSDAAEWSLRFRDRDVNTVADLQYGLVWQRCSVGRSGRACKNGRDSRLSWHEAIALASAFTAPTCHPWRLPSLAELNSLVDTSHRGAAIDPNFFPQTGQTWYWTGTTYDPENAWIRVVSFNDGAQFDSLHTNHGLLRLVCAQDQQLG